MYACMHTIIAVMAHRFIYIYALFIMQSFSVSIVLLFFLKWNHI